MTCREIRDRAIIIGPDYASVIWARDRAVTEYCEEHHLDRECLSDADIVAVRASPAWKMAGVLR